MGRRERLRAIGRGSRQKKRRHPGGGGAAAAQIPANVRSWEHNEFHITYRIAAYLTKLGYKTPRGRDYDPQLVGATLSKLRRPKARTKKITVSVSEVTFWLRSY